MTQSLKMAVCHNLVIHASDALPQVGPTCFHLHVYMRNTVNTIDVLFAEMSG